MSVLGTVLEEMLIPNKNIYWDSISFEADLNKYSLEDFLDIANSGEDLYEQKQSQDLFLKLYLNTYRSFDTGYLKSHSRMNIAKLRERVKEVLNLDKPKIEIGQIVKDSYFNQVYRTAKLTYKIDQELFKILIALIKLKGKNNV